MMKQDMENENNIGNAETMRTNLEKENLWPTHRHRFSRSSMKSKETKQKYIPTGGRYQSRIMSSVVPRVAENWLPDT